MAQPPAGYTNPQGGMLPLPPGYRPRTPPPQAKAPPAAPPSAHGGGRVMYFQKPADALAATGSADGTDETAHARPVPPSPVAAVASVPPAGAASGAPAANWTGPVATVAADVPAPGLLPPPPASRYLPPQPDGPPPPAAAVAYQPPGDAPKPADPPPVVANRQPIKTVPVPPEFIKLPPKENIFMVYNDLELEKAIMERLRQDLREQWVRQNPTKDPNRDYKPEDNERYLVFPALPVVSPPGVAYQPKTASYAPSKVVVEPGYVVHRRLYFEEKNSERAGWDLGPLSVVVSSTYFYRDVLFWPQAIGTAAARGFWDTSAGKCLPGTPSPYYLYPPNLSVTGTAFETLAVTGAAFLFP